MKLLMTGATGFIGAHTAHRFGEAGYDLRLLLRPTSKLDLLEGLEYDTAPGDVTDRASVDAALEGVDAVVHIAGVTSFLPRDAARVHAVNVTGTRNVLEAALARGVKKVLHTSSVAAVGASANGDEELDEGSEWTVGAKANFYVRSKHEGERVAWEVASKGLDLVCVNPSVVTGPGDHYGSSTVFLLNYVKGKFPAYLSGGSGHVDVRDVAQGHLLAFEKGRAGERYILSSQNWSNEQVTKQLVKLTDMKPIRKIPYPLAMVAAGFNELIAARFDPRRAEFNRSTVRVGSLYWYVNNRKSREELGLEYRPIASSIEDTLEWATAHGHLRRPRT